MDTQRAEILNQIQTLYDQGGIISVEPLREWMKSPYDDVKGFVFDLLFNHEERLEPLPGQEKQLFYLGYLGQCISEDRGTLYTYGRFEALDVVRAWLQRLWKDQVTNRRVLEDVRDWLASICREGNADVRDRIVTVLFEHLFEQVEIVAFFRSWQDDPALTDVYTEGVELAKAMHDFNA